MGRSKFHSTYLIIIIHHYTMQNGSSKFQYAANLCKYHVQNAGNPCDMKASISQEFQMPSPNNYIYNCTTIYNYYNDSNCNRHSCNYNWYKSTNNKQQPTSNNQPTTNKQQPTTNNKQPTTAFKNLQNRRFQLQNVANSIAKGRFQLPNAANNMQHGSLRPKMLNISCFFGSFQLQEPAKNMQIAWKNTHSQNSQKKKNKLVLILDRWRSR